MLRPAIVLVLSLLPFLAVADVCEKTFRWTEDPPYTYSATGAPQGVSGISADTVRAVLGMMGCDVSFVEMPWARALAELRIGRVDIVSGAFDTPERREFAHYAAQGSTSPNVLFMRAGDTVNTNILSFEDFLASGLSLGGQIGVNYGPEYAAAIESGVLDDRLVLVPDRTLLWQMLARGRVDAVAASYLTGLMEITRQGYGGQLLNTGIELSSAPAFFIFSKSSVEEEFVSRFNEFHRMFIASEDYKVMVNTHTIDVQRAE
ncbi:transporter substrate-binding domain-containing protein [Salinispirillum sp. LH 10-3-1]|uniref:Transporter substrate-binding domain-containing protein n=2 Tax=Salinispirillum sp. LH 10-3-1 TaxID=2952525 RepID=A0AB38YK90_9GAMM